MRDDRVRLSQPAVTVEGGAVEFPYRWGHAVLLLLLTVLASLTSPASAFRGEELSDTQKKTLERNYKIILQKIKGPFTPNYCVCEDGTRAPVMDKQGRVRSPCAATRFCSAFRAEWAQALADEGMYVANLFAPDLYAWESFPDHDDLVRGYILEKFFIDTHPEHELAQMRAYGGLSGAEYEARDMPVFFERYLARAAFDPNRDFLLAYELQKRFFVRNEWGEIQKVRNMASRIQGRDPEFKPLRDATHNRVSASLIPKLAAYRDALPEGKHGEREDIAALIGEIRKLTSLDEGALGPQLGEIDDPALRQRLEDLLPTQDADPVAKVAALGALMAASRDAVAAGSEAPADRRRLVDLNVTAAAVIQSVGSELLDEGGPTTVGDHLRLLQGLTDAAYGTGLLTPREREAAAGALAQMLARDATDREAFRRDLQKVERTVEWAHNGAALAFGPVWASWTHLLPDVAHITDDIVRGSPMLLFGRVATRLDDHAVGQNPIRHDLFGHPFTTEVRALNPGLALGTLRVAPPEGGYTREQVVALPETPADLQPAAGIVTRGEGNVVSHVQLLARALGIPNAVAAPQAYQAIAPHDGKTVFMVVTPGGRVHLEDAARMSAEDNALYAEFNRNTKRTGDGSLADSGAKLHIDKDRLDVTTQDPLPLTAVRRKDSGIRSGPKAAYLGELAHLFPDHVARGVVVPFGAYYAHYASTKVALPPDSKRSGIAREGEALPEFAARTYAEFFGKLVPAGTDEQALADWIEPRLTIMRHSIEAQPLSAALKAAIRDQLDAQGLLLPHDKTQTVGCFVRSDTNVEDQDNFNGAGLNLTLFNRKSLDDIYAGLKAVWASPFSYRSFSWRQTLIDEPLWVLPSVVILESIPSEKSGVLVTADIDTGDQSKMLIATSEGVGGAVDGTPAETLLWSEDGIELVTQFKSHYRRLLEPGGGSRIVPATGSDYVLAPQEIEALTAAARTIQKRLEPARDPAGNPRAWDIEFGFADGKLWLFQVRPFIGNEDMQNVPALAALDGGGASGGGTITLGERVR